METSGNSIQWRLAPLPVVIAALLSADLLHFFPEHELEDDDGPDEDDEDQPRKSFPAEDEDEEPKVEHESVTHLFIVELRKSFDEIFVWQEGHPPYREDKDQAYDIELDGAGVVRLLLEESVDVELTRTKIENWISDLLGEEEVEEQQGLEDLSSDALDKFEV